MLDTTFAVPLITIGSSRTTRLTLDGPDVLRVHAVIDYGELIDLATGRTLVNGQSIERHRLRTGDIIIIGEHVIEVTVGTTYDAVELKLLDAIEAQDIEALDVYADWLEERGDKRRAEILRIEQRLAAPMLSFHDRRLAEEEQRALILDLARNLDEDWLRRVAPYAARRLLAPTRPPPQRMDWDLPAELQYLYSLQPRT
jgi:uncharacterized protein (TIGR02996 family)